MNTFPCDLPAFLADLRARRVSVWPDGDTLQVWQHNPAKRLTRAELDHLRENKPAVLAYLRQRNRDRLPSNEVCEAWRAKYCNTGGRVL